MAVYFWLPKHGQPCLVPAISSRDNSRQSQFAQSCDCHAPSQNSQATARKGTMDAKNHRDSRTQRSSKVRAESVSTIIRHAEIYDLRNRGGAPRDGLCIPFERWRNSTCAEKRDSSSVRATTSRHAAYADARPRQQTSLHAAARKLGSRRDYA